MEIHETKKADIVVLEPDGRLDTSTSRAFEEKIHEVLSTGERKFVVDLRELEYVSSAGLRVLLMLARRLQSKGGELVLCSPTESVQEVLDISGFTRIFNIAPSQTEALKAINERSKPKKPKATPAETSPAKDQSQTETDRATADKGASDQGSGKETSNSGKQNGKPPSEAPEAPESPEKPHALEVADAPEATSPQAEEDSLPPLSPVANIAVSILKGNPLPELKAGPAVQSQSTAPPAKGSATQAKQPPEGKKTENGKKPPATQEEPADVSPKKDLLDSVSGGAAGAASAKAGFWNRLMGRS